MGGETKRRPDWLNRTSVMIGIGVGLVSLIGGVGKLLADDGPSKSDRYRATITNRLCGDLKAAVQTSQPDAYAGEGGHINKLALISAMDTTAGYLTKGRETLQALPPPSELRDDWRATSDAWADYISFWSDYRQATSTLPAEQLTVFDYPPPEWAQRLNAANNSLSASIEKLMQTPCGGPAPQSRKGE